MCVVIKTNVEFPKIEGVNCPEGFGDITVHANGAWDWTTMIGKEIVAYYFSEPYELEERYMGEYDV